jgi:uncharacterized protein YecE (DUF72 family)
MVAMSWSFMREKMLTAEVNIGADITGRVHPGCAGWNLPRAVQHRFPAHGTHLERYAAMLPAVEINTSFYRPHRAATYARWHDSVPDEFRFSVKVPRVITHQLRLHGVENELRKFIEEVSNLRDKLGCLLVQLPPGLPYERAVAMRFFEQLRTMAAVGIACEPRHASWAKAEVSEDMRLHGSPLIYHSQYPAQALHRLARDIAVHKRLGRRVWCIFDNTASGAAAPDALSLMDELAAAEQERVMRLLPN